ncbi:hypothetical protein [uncultured Paraglaciecola sp.]|uniref:hypothetical protein n=1 Tax=uncultured Paraglaciecola sp. TaxID=1765024 RepID=UPI0030DB7E01|tara:strand:+ start:4479 stop:4739 length:261 start_codon:yes stop_codon:yes gene_type:complete
MGKHSKVSHKFDSALKRILVGCLGLYPTLILVLSILGPITRDLSFPLVVLVEVVVLVPLTQLVSFPLAGRVVSFLEKAVHRVASDT